jgi:hypothetical protein
VRKEGRSPAYEVRMPSSTRVERSKVAMVSWGLFAAACGVAAAYAIRYGVTNDGWRNVVGWIGGLALAALALVGVSAIFFASGTAACPACAASLGGLDPGIACVAPCSCGALVKVAGGRASALQDDDVLEAPLLRVSLPERILWPEGCLVCGAHAEATQPVSVHVSSTAGNLLASAVGLAVAGTVGVGFVRSGGGTTLTVEAPRCARHTHVAALDVRLGRVFLLFRAVGPFRAFLARNKLTAEI